jgi:hypothetical protein
MYIGGLCAMAWLAITIDTAAEKINSVVTVLTAKGFSDLVIEDQEEFETFLEETRLTGTILTKNSRKNYRDCLTSSCTWKIPTKPVWSGWKLLYPS